VKDFPVRPDDDELLVAEFEMLELQPALTRALRSHTRHLATLARAITQIGRAAKTVHPLDDRNHPHYRRRILGQLNRGERRHDLAR
jgi:TnpA family transposase